MPRAYALTDPSMRARLLARLAQGEALAAVCRSAGMPTSPCVRNWAKTDAGFAGELAKARAAGAARRPGRGAYPPFDEAQAKKVLAGLAEGMGVTEALKAAGGPSWRAFRHWRRTQGDFAEAVAERLAAARRTRLHGRWRGFDRETATRIVTRVARGEPLRRVLASDAAFPCLAVVARWRAEDAVFAEGLAQAMRLSRARRGARRLWSDALEEAICLRLVHGASLRGVAADPAMPCGTTLRNWMARKGSFARGVAVACDLRDQIVADRLLGMAEAATPETARDVAREMRPIMGRYGRMRRRGDGE